MLGRRVHVKDLPNYYAKGIGMQRANEKKNRYRDIIPYDRTRIIIGDIRQGVGWGNRYLNGDWVKEYYGGKLWIATQAPLADTVYDFLSVIARPMAPSSPSPAIDLPSPCQVRTVVQLTLNHIGGQEYFPSKVGATIMIEPEPGQDLPPFQVTLLEQCWIAEAMCFRSKVSFVPTGIADTRPIVFTHLLYTAWPDHGVPEKKHEASLLKLIRLADSINKEHSSGADLPAIVHCSAGVGRTGTFITLSSLLRAYGLLSTPTRPSPPPPTPATEITAPLPRLSSDHDLVTLEIDNLREQRMGMVEKLEQLRFIYQMLELAFNG